VKSKYKSYPSYRDSGVEWLGKIPEHWTYSKFGFLKTVLTDYTANGSFADLAKYVTYRDEEDYARLVRLTDLRKNLKNKQGVWIDKDSYEFLKKSALFGGEFLMANVGAYAGLFYQMPYTSKPASLAPNMFMAKFNTKKVSEHFMTYIGISDSAHKQLRLKATSSSAQPKLNKDDFKSIKFVYPSLQEQQTIATYLDKATAKIDTLIEKQTKLIELLKEKRQAVISTAVTRGLDSSVPMKDSGVEWLGEIPEGWKYYRIDWVSTIIRGNTGFKKDELLNNGDYLALQYGKTYKVDEVNEAFNFYVNNEFYKPSQVVHHGDTILISTSETVEDLGHSCFYNRNELGLIGGEQILLKPNTQLVFEKYLYYSSKVFSSKLKKYASGLKVFRFNIDDLKNVFISIPLISEQEKIVQHIDDKTSKIDNLINKATKAIDLLKERRTALISAVVTGKIDVRGEVG